MKVEGGILFPPSLHVPRLQSPKTWELLRPAVEQNIQHL